MSIDKKKYTKQVHEESRDAVWWNQPVAQIEMRLRTDAKEGITWDDASNRLEEIGPNSLPQASAVHPLLLFFHQFTSLIVWVLIAACVVAGALGEWIDAGAIAVIILLNGILGFYQEFKAMRAIESLRDLDKPVCKVIREGQLRSLPITDLVPGDLVQVEAGDTVPADGRLVVVSQLVVQEAALTGESESVAKQVKLLDNQRLALGDRTNMVYKATHAVQGKGLFLVTDTGLGTQIGRIAELLSQQTEEKTPLQERLNQLGKKLVYLCLAVVAFLFFFGMMRGLSLLETTLTALSLAVAAIPEGLPAVVTITLAIGMHLMAKRNALIRHLPAVETLGCTSVICSDKTGTLTQNLMTVREVWVFNDLYKVSGDGYAPEGGFTKGEEAVDSLQSPAALLLLRMCVLCNSASLYEEGGKWQITGDPTEGALLTVAAKADITSRSLTSNYSILSECPFDSERKRMSVLVDTTESMDLYVKGAPDIILRLCSHYMEDEQTVEMDAAVKQRIRKQLEEMALKGLRVLAFAKKTMPAEVEISVEDERELVFVGLTACIDPPRPEVREALKACKEAGIAAVMITGDHKNTALAVARELQMIDHDESSIDGLEIDEMDDTTLKQKVEAIRVYARVSAEHKMRVIEAWQQNNHVVAMTGDGVNDAVAVKEADIGVSMGITGTDVTKQASDMIILDDNFATIVAAVKEGRGIFDNIVRFVSYLLSCNVAEILLIFMSMLLFLENADGSAFLILAPVQLLWINLATDGLPAVALAFDPPSPGVMKHPPRSRHAPIIGRGWGVKLLGVSVLIVAFTLFVTIWALAVYPSQAQTVAFTTVVMMELVKAVVLRRAYRLPLFSNAWIWWAIAGSLFLQLLVVYVPVLQMVFDTVGLNFATWIGILLAVGSFGVFSSLVLRPEES